MDRKSDVPIRGFTLIELLIVIIIIGILASIAVPQFLKVSERAKATEGIQALGQLKRAQLRYYDEHHNMADSIGDLDYTPAVARYFGTPVPEAVDYKAGNESLGTITRNASKDNAGFGAYVFTIHGNGVITCSGGKKCPPGF